MSIENGATTIQAEENAAKEHTTLNVNEAVTFSNVHLHTTYAGDPYYIGDAYDKTPLNISQEWEIDTCGLAFPHILSLCSNWLLCYLRGCSLNSSLVLMLALLKFLVLIQILVQNFLTWLTSSPSPQHGHS